MSGAPPPDQMCKGPAVPAPGLRGTQSTGDKDDSATHAAESNPIDALRRRWAARGFQLVELADGTLLAGAHHLPNLYAASRSLAQFDLHGGLRG